jgi:hypothetical protein
MARTGGGYGSKQHVDVRAGQKVEPKASAVSPAAVNQMGVSTAFKKEELFQGPTLQQGKMPPTGIANAVKGPPGAAPGGYGRTIYGSGSQLPTPAAREMEPGRGFDERPNKSNRP